MSTIANKSNNELTTSEKWDKIANQFNIESVSIKPIGAHLQI